MKMEIDINAVTMENIIKEGVEALTLEEKKDIVKSCLANYFADRDVLEMLLFESHRDYSNKICIDYNRPRPVMNQAIKESLQSDAIKPVLDAVTEVMKEHGPELVSKALIEGVVASMVTDDFRREIYNAIYNQVSGMIQNK